MDNSPGLANIARDAATVEDPAARRDELEREMGIKDQQGNYQTETDQTDMANKRQALAAQLEGMSKTTEKTLEPTAPATPGEAAPPAPKTGFFGEDIQGDKNNMLVQATGGVVSGLQAMVNGGLKLGDWINDKIGYTGPNAHAQPMTFADDYFPPSELLANQMVRGATQFLSAFSGVGATAQSVGLVSQGAKLGVAGKAMAGAATDFLAFDGGNKRLSDLLQDIPALSWAVPDILVSKPDDTELQGRMKNAAEGLGLGVLLEGITHGVTFLKNQRAASEGLQLIEKVKSGELPPEALKDIKNPSAQEAIKPQVDETTGALTTPPPKTVIDPDTGATKLQVEADLKPTLPARNPEFYSGNLDNLSPEEILNPNPDNAGKGGGLKLNLTNIKTTDDITSVIRNIEQADQSAISTRLGPKDTEDQLRLLSKELGVSPQEILSKRQGEAFNSKQIYAMRVYHASSAVSLQDTAAAAIKSGTDADKFAFMQSLQTFKAINLALTGAKTEAGRALKAMSYGVAEGTPEHAQMISDYLKYQGDASVDAILKGVAALPPEKMATIAQKSIGKRWFNATLETYLTNLLAGPWTYVTNATSNALTLGGSIVERGLAPYTGAAKEVDQKALRQAIETESSLRGANTAEMNPVEFDDHQAKLMKATNTIKAAQKSGVEKGEFLTAAQAAAKAFTTETTDRLTGMLDGIRMLWQSSKEGAGTLGGKTEEIFKGISAEQLGFQNPQNFLTKGTNTFIDAIGNLQRFSASMLDSADDFQKAVNYRTEVQTLGFRLGTKSGLSGEELGNFMKNFADNPPNYIDSYAKQQAKVLTFTNPLESEFAQNVDKFFKTDILGTQPLRFIIPFTRTPLNMAQFAIDRTPLVMMSDRYKSAIRAGGAEAQMARSRIALGGVLGISAMSLSYSNLLTGGGPANSKMSKEMQDMGWSPYSLKVGDKYVPFDKMGPFGKVMGLYADAYDITAHGMGHGLDVEEVQNLTGLLGWAVTEQLSPEYLMGSMGKLINALHTRGADDLNDLLSDKMSKSIPLMGVSNDIRRMQDPTRRDQTHVDPYSNWPLLQEVMTKVKNQIPGLSKDLPPQKNIWGDDVMYPSQVGPSWVNPFNASKIQKDPIMGELVRLGYAGPAAKVKAPDGQSWLEIGMPQRTIHMQGAVANLDPKQYARFVEISAGKNVDGDVQPLRQELNAMVKDPEYKSGSDQVKRVMIKKTITEYRKYAKGKMLDEYPDLVDKLQKSADAKNSALSGGSEDVNQ